MPAPNPTGESDNSTLPDPELNPLLNPLLAAHMGRWAEVYFTTPPERRGQAVAELLRELEAASSTQPDSQIADDVTVGRVAEETETTPALHSPLDAAELAIICRACAHNNPVGHRYCGMCGASLQISPPERPAEIAHSRPIAEASADQPEPSFDAPLTESSIPPDSFFTAASPQANTSEPSWPPLRNPQLSNDVPSFADRVRNDFPDFAGSSPRFDQSVPHFGSDRSHFANDRSPFAEDLPGFAKEPARVPYRYRLYVGVGLAILLAVLIYMARRGTEALSGAPGSPPSKVIPAARPVPATSEPPARTANTVPAAKTGNENLPMRPVQHVRQPEASSPKQTAVVRTPPGTVPIGKPAVPAAAQSGAEELATAEKYLNGSPGSRDSTEAAQWLWKSVGKGNPAATVVLSDLYLRGDGVPKSCDQARLLLDASARKGVKGAADRLRNLQAFGCQ